MSKRSETPDMNGINENVVIKNYPSKLCREHISKSGGKFFTLSFQIKNDWLSVIVPSTAISTIEGHDGKVDIELGQESDVMIATTKDGETFRPVPIFCGSIKRFIAENKERYLKSVAI